MFCSTAKRANNINTDYNGTAYENYYTQKIISYNLWETAYKKYDSSCTISNPEGDKQLLNEANILLIDYYSIKEPKLKTIHNTTKCVNSQDILYNKDTVVTPIDQGEYIMIPNTTLIDPNNGIIGKYQVTNNNQCLNECNNNAECEGYTVENSICSLYSDLGSTDQKVFKYNNGTMVYAKSDGSGVLKTPEKSNNDIIIAVIVILLLLFIVIGVGIYYYYYRKKNGPIDFKEVPSKIITKFKEVPNKIINKYNQFKEYFNNFN